jgi:hypothetical protein
MDFISTKICQVWFISLKNLSDFVCFLFRILPDKTEITSEKEEGKEQDQSENVGKRDIEIGNCPAIFN